MKELNTMEVEQVAGGGLVSSLLGDVVSTVTPLVNTLVKPLFLTQYQALLTGIDGILSALF